MSNSLKQIFARKEEKADAIQKPAIQSIAQYNRAPGDIRSIIFILASGGLSRKSIQRFFNDAGIDYKISKQLITTINSKGQVKKFVEYLDKLGLEIVAK